MSSLLTFIQLTENDKRVLYTVFILLIILLALLSFIGSIIVKVTKLRGDELSRHIHDPIKCGIVRDEKHFSKYVGKKNIFVFYKESWIPILIVIAGVVVYLIYCSVFEKWGYNPWDMDTGFGSLWFIWDFSTIFQVNPDGTTGLLINWPELINTPTFKIENWAGYISCLCFLVGGLWYLYAVQGLIGRVLKAGKLKKTIFDKSLDTFNLYDALYGNQIKPETKKEEQKNVG